ncbi:MAG: amidohydrolase, partial [Alphaproteobacteria bacterium]|nr:amidohydrolase [Alphaproteobacteria bacterium]
MRLLQAAVLAIAMIALTVAAFADDDDDVPPTPPPPSVDAKFTAYAQPVIAFTHAEIVDGTGGKPRYDQTLIVKDGRIAALGPAARTPVPKGATVIDGHGKTLL